MACFTFSRLKGNEARLEYSVSFRNKVQCVKAVDEREQNLKLLQQAQRPGVVL